MAVSRSPSWVGEAPSFSRTYGPKLLVEVREAGRLSVLKQEQGWAIADGYAGIEDAHLVVVNVRTETTGPLPKSLLADVRRLREDQVLFADIIGQRGARLPVTVLVADVTAPDDRGFKKALARIRRATRLATA
jgi:hypothetical protein